MKLIGTPNRAKLHSYMPEIVGWRFSLNKIQWQALGYRFIGEWTAIQRLVRDCTRFYRSCAKFNNSGDRRDKKSRDSAWLIARFSTRTSSRQDLMPDVIVQNQFSRLISISNRFVFVTTLILLSRKFRNLRNSNRPWAIIYPTII